MICRPYYDNDEINRVLNQQQGKDYFIPDTLEELYNYKDYEYLFIDNSELIEKMIKFLRNRIDGCDSKEKTLNANIIVIELLDSINNGLDGVNNLLSDLLTQYKVNMKSQNDLMNFFKMFQQLNNSMRTVSNKGFSPHEMISMHPFDANDLKLTIGPNIRERMLNESGFAEEYLDGVMSSNIPKVAKQSLIEEIKFIIKERNSHKA